MPITIQQFREQAGGLPGFTDEELAQRLHQTLRPNVPFEQFAPTIGYDVNSDFGRGFEMAGRQIVGGLSRLGAGLADRVGLDGAAQWLGDAADSQFNRAQQLSRSHDDITNVNSIGSAFDYIQQGGGQLVAHAIPTLLGGGLGGAAASRGLTGAAALQAGARGALAGAAAASYPVQTGQMYQDLVEQGKDELGRAALFAVPATVVDAVAEVGPIARALTRPSAQASRLRRTATGAGQGVATEVPAELTQTAIERQSAYKDLTGEDATNEYLNAAALAGLGGGARGAVTGAFSRGPLPEIDAPAEPAARPAPTREGGLDLLRLQQVETQPEISPGVRQMPDGTFYTDPEQPPVQAIGRPGWVARKNTPTLAPDAEVGTQGELIPRRFSDPIRPVEQVVEEAEPTYTDTATRDLFADTPSAMVPTMFNPASQPTTEMTPRRAASQSIGAVAMNIRSQLAQQLGRADAYTTKLAFDLSRVVGDLPAMQDVVAREEESLDKALTKLDRQVIGESNVLNPQEYAQRRNVIEDKRLALEALRELVGQYQSAQTRAFAEEALARPRAGVVIGAGPQESTTAQDMRARVQQETAGDQQAALAEQIAQVDARVQQGQQAASQAERMQILRDVLSDSTRRAPVARFREALRRAGFRNLDLTQQEQDEIMRVTSRRSDVRAATKLPPGLAAARGKLTPRASLDVPAAQSQPTAPLPPVPVEQPKAAAPAKESKPAPKVTTKPAPKLQPQAGLAESKAEKPKAEPADEDSPVIKRAAAQARIRKAAEEWSRMRDPQTAPRWDELPDAYRERWAQIVEDGRPNMADADDIGREANQELYGEIEKPGAPLEPKLVKLEEPKQTGKQAEGFVPKVNGEPYAGKVPKSVSVAQATKIVTRIRQEMQENSGTTRDYHLALADALMALRSPEIVPEARKALDRIVALVPEEDVLVLRYTLGLERDVLMAENPDNDKGARVDPVNAMTTHAALDWIGANSANPFYRQLAPKLKAVINDFPISYASVGMQVESWVNDMLQTSNGFYAHYPISGREELWVWANRSNEDLLMHELLHAATHRGIESDSDFKNTLADMGAKISNTLVGAKYDAKNAPPGVSRETLEFFSKVIRNPHEVLTYGMSSPSFAVLMQRMAADGQWMADYRTPDQKRQVVRSAREPIALKPEPKVNLWQKFVDAVRSLFGMEPKYTKELQDVIAYNRAAARANERAASRVELVPLKEVLDRLLEEALARQAQARAAASGQRSVQPNATRSGDPQVMRSEVAVNDDPDFDLPDAEPVKGLRAFIEDKVADVKASGIGLGALTLRQIGSIYDSPVIKSFVDKTQAMITMARKLQGEAFKIDTEWRALPEKVSLPLQKLMLAATMARAHVDVAVTDKLNSHLTTDEEKAKHAELAARYAELVAQDPRVAKVYAEVRDKLAADWKLRGELLRNTIINAYRPELQGRTGELTLEGLADVPKDKRADVLKLLRTNVARKSVRDMWSDLDDHAETLAQLRGPYFPLMRFGRHVVVVKSAAYDRAVEEFDAATSALRGLNEQEVEPGTPEAAALDEAIKVARKEVTDKRKKLEEVKDRDGDYAVEFYERKSEANRRRDQLVAFYEGRGRPVQVEVKMREQYVRQLDSASPTFLRKIEDTVKASLPKSDSTAVERAMRDLLIHSMPERSALKSQLRRLNVRGAQAAQMRRAFAATAVRNSWHLSRLQHGRDLHEALQALRDSGDDTEKLVGDELGKRYVKSMTFEENNPVADFVSNATYLSYLGLSPSFLMMNLAQPWVVSMPLLAARRGVGVRTASAELGKAFAETGRAMKASYRKEGSFRFELDLSQFNADNGERQMLEALFDKGIIDITFEHDVGAVASGRAETTWGKTVELASLPAHHTEVMNRVMTALAAYRIARQRGESVGAAVTWAESVVHESHLDYTPENAPRWFTQFGALGRIVLQFKKYSQGMMYLLSRNLYRAVKGDAEARRTLGYMLGTNFAVAGMTGLPFAWVAGAIAAMIEQLGEDDDEPNFKLAFRDGLADIFGETVADLLMKGLPAALGADVAQRIGLGDLGNPLAMNKDNAEGRDWMAYTVFSLLGPAASLAGNYAEAVSLAASDPVRAAASVMPKVLADPLRAMHAADKGLVTRTGNTIVPAEEISAAQLTLRAFGLQPTEQANMYERRSAFYEAKDERDKVRTALIKEWAAARTGDGSMAEVQEKVRAFNQRHPDNRITGANVSQHMKQQRRRENELAGGVQVRKQDRQLAEEFGLTD